MQYLRRMTLVSERAENAFIRDEKRTCFDSFYPFKIFPLKGLKEIEFDDITMFYGGNGSGKSTLINLIAHKMNATRYSPFNLSPFFDAYADRCMTEFAKRPKNCTVLASDDVFDYVLNSRFVNEDIDQRRNELLQKYAEAHAMKAMSAQADTMKGLWDYDRWSETREILSPKRSQSDFIRKRVEKDVELRSNGETVMSYFVERIEEDGIYFLDEPENSLSLAYQMELADYIAATQRVTATQFIIATHSPVFLAIKGAKIYDLDHYPVGVCKWTELENVRKYFDFFMERKEEFL